LALSIGAAVAESICGSNTGGSGSALTSKKNAKLVIINFQCKFQINKIHNTNIYKIHYEKSPIKTEICTKHVKSFNN